MAFHPSSVNFSELLFQTERLRGVNICRAAKWLIKQTLATFSRISLIARELAIVSIGTRIGGRFIIQVEQGYGAPEAREFKFD